MYTRARAWLSFKHGDVLGVAVCGQLVQVSATILDRTPGERDPLLLQHHFVDGALDLGRGELLRVGVEHRQLPAAHVDFVVAAADAAQTVDPAVGRLHRSHGAIGDVQHAAGDAERRFFQDCTTSSRIARRS